LQKWISSRSDFIRTLRIIAIRRPNTPNCARYRQRRYASVYDGFHSTLPLKQKTRSNLTFKPKQYKKAFTPSTHFCACENGFHRVAISSVYDGFHSTLPLKQKPRSNLTFKPKSNKIAFTPYENSQKREVRAFFLP